MIMLTFLQAQAILSILIAFGVPQITVNQVHDILIPKEASTTPIAIIPTNITPIIENQPVYFGSTNPTPPIIPTPPQPTLVVDNTPASPAPVVQSKPMDAPPKVDVQIYHQDRHDPVEGITDLSGGYFLGASSSKPLDFSSTILPTGVAMSIIYNGRTTVEERPTVYHYEARLTGATQGVIEVSLKDMSGNTITKQILIQ